jgi:hypothetical protein
MHTTENIQNVIVPTAHPPKIESFKTQFHFNLLLKLEKKKKLIFFPNFHLQAN